MHLEDMNYETTGGGELLMTDMALEMLCLLMLNEDLLIIELSLAVKAPNFRNSLLLLLSHGARKRGGRSSLAESRGSLHKRWGPLGRVHLYTELQGFVYVCCTVG